MRGQFLDEAYSGTFRREIVQANASLGELRRDKEKLSTPNYGAFLGSKFKRVNSPKFEFTKGPNSSNTWLNL